MLSLLKLDDMRDASAWTALTNDTTGLAASAVRLTGKYSLEFDKVDGAANGVTTGAYRTLDENLSQELIQIHDVVAFAIYCSAVTNIASAHVKIGTDASNHYVFSVADSTLNAAGWSLCSVAVGDAALVGTGWDPSAITYLEVGAIVDAQDDALANIKFDCVQISAAPYTRT